MLEISDINSWKNFFDMIFDSSTIVELKLDQEKCKITLLNNSHIAFYDVEYTKDFFDVFDVDGVESVLIYVEDFYKILKSVKKDDVLILESDENTLKVIFEHDGNRRLFELPQGEDYSDVPPLPSIEYEGTFILSIKDLEAPVNDLDSIIKTNKFTMITDSDELKIISPTESMTQYLQVINIDNTISNKVIVDLNYVKQLLKLKKISDIVEFSIGENKPLKWKVVSPFEDIKLTGLIAPIIEEEE